MKSTRGYSMLELLIVVGLVAVVGSIAFSVYNGYQRNAADAAVLANIKELQDPLQTYAATHAPVEICQDYASVVSLPTIEKSPVDMMVTFSPLDGSDVSKGYRASVVVSADATGRNSMEVARMVHEQMSQRNQVAPGATITDSVMAYEVYLTPNDTPFCLAMSTTATTAAASSSQSSTQAGAINPVSAPSISFGFTTRQEVLEFANTGTGSVINNGPLQTGGDMKELSVEFNVIGGPQVATTGSHGATFISYARPGDENEFYVWNPQDLTVRIGGTEYKTGIDTTVDQGTHRYSTLWSSDTGLLQVLVDGEVKFTRPDTAKGYTIPGGGVVALAQDQDHFQIEDGTHGDNHGFSPGDAFHGQIFNAALATKAVDPAAIASTPLGAAITPADGLVLDVQMQGGTAKDLTGNHQLTTRGDLVSRTVDVDTSVAIPNAGAMLSMHADVDPAQGDTLVDLRLVGLLPSTSVSDGAGNSGSGGSISVLGWNLASLSAKLPDGVKENMNIGVIATVKGLRGDLATASSFQSLVLDPSKPIPPESS